MRGLILGLMAILMLSPGTALAAPIASPTSYSISAVNAYGPALETGDQLYIIAGSIIYGTNPAENAGQAWLVRLFENGVEISSTTIYAYYNSGYANFVASIYLPASMAATWGGNVTVSLEPNPTLTWVSIPAAISYAAIVWNTASTFDEVSTAVANRVRALGLTLNTAWVALDLVESVNGLLKLTSYGEGYFDVAIPILRTICPELYQSVLNSPILVDHDYTDTGKVNLDSLLVGTPMDPTNVANDWGLSRMWATGMIWGAVCILVAGAFGYKAQTAKPTMYLFGGLMIAGSFMGFGLFQGIIFGLLGGGSLILAFAWRGA